MNWETLLNKQRFGTTQIETNENHLIRNPFETDYDRIIFSSYFRKLQDKTQVFPLPENNFVHNRLTHSLEVSSVGRSLGREVAYKILPPPTKKNELKWYSQIIDFGSIVAAACLAHDIGNPPFGHSGEKAISEYFITHPEGQKFKNKTTEEEWNDLISFEGNAQGFRLLCNNQYSHKMKLTYGTLATFSKYPCQSFFKEKDKNKRSHQKYGFFQSEKKQFINIAQNTQLIETHTEKAWERHPLTYLVEAADDICYHIIDMEDACRLGWIHSEVVQEKFIHIIEKNFQPDKLKKYNSPQEKIAVLRALTIKSLIQQTSEVFITHQQQIMNGTFKEDLFSILPSKNILKNIKELSRKEIYNSHPVKQKEIAGFEVISGLMEAFCTSSYKVFSKDNPSHKNKIICNLLPEDIQPQLQNTNTIYLQLRIILDFISGLTDGNALALYRNIKGISIP
ncbi:MAG: deoxyguanosinetriphosphate triphosphohydrolase [Chitinophagaceae bacterium]|nr:deoxyguanosinetriphosphate triphosphohydrolase [Chitinophagaceae bacterium]